MRYRRFIKIRYLFYLSMTLFMLVGVSSQANAQRGGAPVDQTGALTTQQEEAQKITPADRQQAAARASALGQNQVGMGAATMAAPGAAPHYFSHPNYANSPLPVLSGAVIAVGNPLVERAYATDFNAASPVPVLVVLPDAILPDGLVQSFEIFNQTNPGGSPGPSAGNTFHAYILRPTGTAAEYYVVFDSGEFTVPPSSNPAGEVTSFPVPDIAVQAGDIIAYYGAGVPVDITASGTDILSFPAPAAPVADTNITLGGPDFPVYPQARTYSFSASVLDLSGNNTVYTGGIRKFVDGLAGLGAAGANNLGQYISIAVPDTTSYPGSDYYEIAVIEFTEQMHSDLPPTTHRGYIQIATAEVPGIQVPLVNPDGSPILMPDGSQAYGVDNPHYLGASIVAQKDRPVRIKFYNLLPTGHYDPNTGLRGGDLFLPVDTSVMGSGMGPEMYDTVNGTMMMEPDPQNPMCGNPDKPYGCYTENRATLHLHGGISPWISDGTPHQWITPAAENTPYPQGVSVQNVPDMAGCELATDGCMTFYYTNQQSARLSFYHDHAWGITRLNVYAGEAAAYLIRDETEQALIDNGTIPSVEIPLVIQDKTFVPSEEQLAISDETWDINRWGGFGSLWFPHVYSPAQNPGDASGVNQYGRWAYGPWFWPPTNAIEHGPIDNPYYDPNCNPDLEWCEPPLMPGTPFNSMGMEAFNDTPTVNGTVYPTITLEPQAYRFRILSVANDRFFNLSLYRAVDANGNPCDLANPNPAPESTGVTCTEVALNPDEVAAALTDPAGAFPTPVAGSEGPSWIQIGSEGGFLPSPAIVPPHPITWVTDPTVFNAGNVDQHSLLLGPAERADVIVDFSAYAGQTLILYNDAPAAFPARDPRYDYYTGNPDLRDTGGAPSTLPGYGPNIRTVMQIRIADTTPAPAFDVAALETAFTHQADGSGVFESGQNPIIVGQGAYNDAYGTSFQNNGPLAGLVQIFDTAFSFNTLLGNTLTMPLQSKQIQDEMGEAFGHMYGRMSGFMGVETPNPQAGLQNMILMGYINPPTEVLDGVEVGGGDFNLEVTPIAVADDGTQIWKITHNGVDTHPVHWHLYDVQLINRVGWDGIVRKPDPNELGWKDTIRVSPLEDTIVAVRPIIPHFPFEIPNSVRLLDPSMPEGAYIANTTAQEAMGLPIFAFAPNGEPIDIINHYINFGWEYVWHCHILSHEEMDMMRPQVVGVAPPAPTDLALALAGDMVTLTWTDNSINETGFVIERATDAAFTTGIRSFTIAADETTFVDSLAGLSGNFYYRVQGINVVGDTWDYSDPNLNEGASFPTKTIASEFTAAVAVEIITAPTNLVATLVGNTQVDLNWTDNSGNETGFTIERCTGAGCTDFAAIASVGADVTTYSDVAVAADTSYLYRVFAFNANVSSLPSNEVAITTTVQVPPGVYFSIIGTDPIPGVPAPHDDADIYTWDNTAFGRSFDGSAAGLMANADIDGLSIVDANHFYLSFIPDTDLPGLGTVQDEDVVYYDNGVWSVFFDGTAYGLINAGQDIDAIDVVGGILYFSTVGGGNNNAVPGVAGPYDDADIYAWDGTNISRVFDASLAGLPGAADIDGLAYVDANNFYLSFNATELTLLGVGAVQDEDIVRNDNGNWSLYFDGTAQGLITGGQDLDAIDVGIIQIPPAAPTTLVALLGSITQVDLSWVDNADNETGFTIERCAGAGCTDFAPVASVLADVTSFSDTTVVADTSYTYRVFAFNSDGVSLLSNEATIVTTVPLIPGLYFSMVGGGNTNALPGLAGPYDDADVYTWNGSAFGRLVDAAALGLPGNADVDGMAVIDANRFYVSFLVDTTLPGLGTVQDEDVVYYDNGVWSVFFDGTAYGLVNAGQDVDALDVVGGVLYFSVTGSGNTNAIPGVAGPYDDADIYAWDGAAFSRVFDASLAGLPGAADIDGLVYAGANTFYMSFNAAELNLLGIGPVQDEDVVLTDNGNWSLYFDGTAAGLILGGHDLDAIDIP